jgi:hypothetical protein
MEIAVDWFVRGCIVAALIAVWQLANATVHVPYPEDLFYSNKSHVVYRAYKISGLFRLNGPFNEASEMAGFLTVGLGLIGWKLFTQPLRWSTGLSFLLLLSMILMTFSSTGYLVITFMLLCGGYLYIRHLRRQGGISPAKLLIALTLLLGATAMGASHAVRDTLTKVIHTTLLDKDKSASYRQRNESHTAALTTLSATYYMGAGWGSIRASGFAFFLLGSVGILGTALFCGYYISLFVPLFRKRPRSLKARGDLYERSLFGATILMLGMAVAGSEPTVPIMWALFAVATAGPALVRVSAATPDLIPFAAHRLRPGTAAFSNELLTR